MAHVKMPREVLEAELARYLTAGPREPQAAYVGAARHRVLPLFNDFVGCWALDMTGRLVFFPWEAPEELESVSDRPADAIGANAALAQGSVRFPALAVIRPVRPADAVPCTTCDGTGRLTGVPDNVVCACGGLGWLPPSSRGAA
ncbi:MAG: hypothetical protein ACRD2R_00460 [Terriglobales bacterium]